MPDVQVARCLGVASLDIAVVVPGSTQHLHLHFHTDDSGSIQGGERADPGKQDKIDEEAVPVDSDTSAVAYRCIAAARRHSSATGGWERLDAEDIVEVGSDTLVAGDGVWGFDVVAGQVGVVARVAVHGLVAHERMRACQRTRYGARACVCWRVCLLLQHEVRECVQLGNRVVRVIVRPS